MSIDRRIYSFQYRLISCYVLLLISLAVYAQSGKERFVGRVVDTETNQPVPFATVRLLALPDSILLVGGATDIQGKFQLAVTIPKSKSILLHISYIGYTSVYRTISVSANNKTPTLGNISLSPESISLNETVVVGQAPMAVTEGDTTVFNASAYRTPEGSMLEELVKQLPGGEIDEDGKLLIHGKEVKKILVDGKEFFSDDPKAALKNLPVEMIEKLKAYERQSDLARLTGIDDGEEEMILDLSVKKNMKRGWMENFMGGYGSKDRYELANTLNRFRDNSQLTVIGNLNNTNNQGFSEMQGESASSSGNLRTQKGLTTSRSLGVNATHDWKRVKFRSNIQYMGTDRLEDSRTTVDNYLRKDKSITESTGHNRQGNDNLVANAFLEWKMDSVTTLIFRPQYRTAANDRSSNGFQQGWGNDVLLNERESSGTTHSSSYNLTMMLQLSRKLSRMGRNIALKVDYGTNESSTDRTSLSTTHYFKNNAKNVKNQKIEDRMEGYNYRLQLVYVEPLPWFHFLQFRYSYQHRVNNSDRFVYNWNKELEEFAPDYDEDASNCFENQYSNHLFNLAVRTSRKKYNYNIGADFEPQKSVSRSLLEKATPAEEPLRKSVFNISPTVNFRYKFSKRTRLQIVYRGKSRQPNIRDLQPVTDRTNPLNIRVGNPGLKPSFTHSMRLFYNTYNAELQRGIMTHASFSATQNSISNSTRYNEETGGLITRPENINGNWNAFGMFGFNTALKNKKYTINTFTNVNYQNNVAFLYNQDTKNNDRNTSTGLTLGERVTGSYRNDWFEFSLNGSINYTAERNKLRPENNQEPYTYSYGASTNITMPWKMTLATNIANQSRRGYRDSSMNRDELIWNAQLAQSLLKGAAFPDAPCFR